AVGVAQQLALGRGQAVALFRLGLVQDLAYRILVLSHRLPLPVPSKTPPARRKPRRAAEGCAGDAACRRASDRLFGAHGGDLVLVEAELGQDLVGVLAQKR